MAGKEQGLFIQILLCIPGSSSIRMVLSSRYRVGASHMRVYDLLQRKVEDSFILRGEEQEIRPTFFGYFLKYHTIFWDSVLNPIIWYLENEDITPRSKDH